MAPLVALTEKDYELLASGEWAAGDTCRRSLRLARLGLCRHVQGSTTWRTTDKGHLTLAHHKRSTTLLPT